jgi:hypothetical protein
MAKEKKPKSNDEKSLAEIVQEAFIRIPPENILDKNGLGDLKVLDAGSQDTGINFGGSGSISIRTVQDGGWDIKNDQPPLAANVSVRATGSGQYDTHFVSTGNHDVDIPVFAPTMKDSQYPITLYIDPGEADANDIADLFSALNDLYQHFGGSNLKFVSNGAKVMAEDGEFA